ncbi:hypothetical protein TSOC_008908 [Tetrabaena socialis]|uniref:Uncharacterized protein n=1 Tax=Tetrabaena socialis TaxID=47790 RepID=A0A2J7ZX75_9CHLO|nr:hypothetical protein TSOC_008908 [Tetrabaena socialis]|eukprot:PNH04880.1 hypothetical protein TSOC_008908 [Tetrabaena socialis]
MHALRAPSRSISLHGGGQSRGQRCSVVAAAVRPTAVWTRPTPDRDQEWIKPSYVPQPLQPSINPGRESPIYAPVTPEFRPAELPETPKELPNSPKLPERRPDDIPAGNPKEKPPPPDKREAPPSKEKETPRK